MVTFSNEEKYSGSEAQVELELQELKKEFSDFPVKVKTDEVSDTEQNFSLDSVDSELGATKVPFPPPPTFCSGLSEEPLSLI